MEYFIYKSHGVEISGRDSLSGLTTYVKKTIELICKDTHISHIGKNDVACRCKK